MTFLPLVRDGPDHRLTVPADGSILAVSGVALWPMPDICPWASTLTTPPAAVQPRGPSGGGRSWVGAVQP
ncbi:hypothetical protein [Nonomuraea dietziae]|uniref:hypothetical protein n=1 Tax=Nonomuraea dietziae TaxID=65515 RepID=UPI00343669B5